MLTDMAMNAIKPDSGGGINTELVLGDKEQVLGTNQEVKADNIGKVVGTSDNTVNASSAKAVTVNNYQTSLAIIIALGVLSTLIGYLLPRPKRWKQFMRGTKHDD